MSYLIREKVGGELSMTSDYTQCKSFNKGGDEFPKFIKNCAKVEIDRLSLFSKPSLSDIL
jgi:hypothetical protein